jgi:hypothetical protein
MGKINSFENTNHFLSNRSVNFLIFCCKRVFAASLFYRLQENARFAARKRKETQENATSLHKSPTYTAPVTWLYASSVRFSSSLPLMDKLQFF